MAIADTARLIASLELDARKFHKQLGAANVALAKSESRAYHAGQQIGTGIKRGLAIGAAGVAFLALNVGKGLDSLIELEKQTAQTNAVLKSTGGVAGITAEQVGALAQKYEDLNATVGDEVIRSAENLLLTFTNVRTKAFEPTLRAALDMNTALGGGPDQLAGVIRLLGRALDNPAKGLSLLERRTGKFTDGEKKAIAQHLKNNDILGAQTIILDKLNKKYGGSFLAQGGTTAGKVKKFQDSIDDLQRSLAEALLPAIGNVADALSTLLKDPATVRGIKDLGDEIGKLFSKGNITHAAQVVGGVIDGIRKAAPVIKSGLGTAADLIGKVVDAFQKLPPDVQKLAVGALIANKLTGGLITNIVGGLAGAFKNMVTASMNVEAATVVVNGAVGGAAGAAGAAGGAGKLGKLGNVLKVLGGITIIGAAAAIADEVHNAIKAGPNIPASQLSWPWGPKNTPKLLPEIFGGNGALGGQPGTPAPGNAADRAGVATEKTALQQYQAQLRIEAADRQRAAEEHGRGERLVTSAAQTKLAIDAGNARIVAANKETARETTRGAQATAAAARAGGARAAQAIRDKKLSTTVNVAVQNNTTITTRDVAKKLSFAQNMRIYG